VSRWGPSVDGALTTLGVIGAGVVILSVVALQSGPASTNGALNPAGGITSNQTGGPSQNNNSNVPGAAATTGPNAAPGTGGTRQVLQGGKVTTTASCAAGQNDGSTDRGVSRTSIKLGATVVQSGIGASFLGPVSTALNAVKNQVNQTGGICGRRIDLSLIDDGWDPDRGFQFIQNLVQDKQVFALAVDPSSEGLRIGSLNHYFTKTHTPVVGSDGMLNAQYTDPWIWPIAASTVSTMHIMAHDACTRLRAHQFSIVFDSKYRFGVEGAYAFNQAVKRCTGHDIPGYFDPSTSGGCTSRFCAIAAGQTSYDTENKTWNDQCFGGSGGGKCDFVAFLLEPNEALNFLRNGTTIQVTKGMAQTLFTRSFASGCGSICDGAMVWTGYNPPIEQFAALPAVKQYVSTVQSVNPTVDILNQFLEGGYAGMELLVDELKQLGAHPTRDGLAALLDRTDYNGGLTTPLSWRAGHHLANGAMQAFSIEYKGGFDGFRNVTGWVKDPYLGMDVK
jgi:ABC-type branched-subunit amino acid transport system substrate-binding protein